MWTPVNSRPSTSPLGSTASGANANLKMRSVVAPQSASSFIAWGGSRRSAGDTSMMIEGCKTGEEKPLVSRERPSPVAAVRAVSSAPPTAPPAAVASAPRDLMKLRRLQQEVQRLREENTRSDTERVELQQRLGAVSDAHQTAVARIVTLEKELKEKDLSVQRADAIQSDLARRLASTTEASDASSRRVESEMARTRSQLAEALAAVTAAQRENRSLSDRLRTAESQHAADVNAIDSLSMEVRKYQSVAADASRRDSDLKRDADAALQAAVRRGDSLQRSVTALEERLRERQASTDDIHRFIISICRPQFPVVKDESLKAITSTTDTEGFVLVPLELMLGGYRLLPEEHRKGIAEEHKRRQENS